MSNTTPESAVKQNGTQHLVDRLRASCEQLAKRLIVRAYCHGLLSQHTAQTAIDALGLNEA